MKWLVQMSHLIFFSDFKSSSGPIFFCSWADWVIRGSVEPRTIAIQFRLPYSICVNLHQKGNLRQLHLRECRTTSISHENLSLLLTTAAIFYKEMMWCLILELLFAWKYKLPAYGSKLYNCICFVNVFFLKGTQTANGIHRYRILQETPAS